MARKKQLIIPIFIPQQGCPHQCVFCNQSKITGKEKLPDVNEVSNIVRTYLKTWKGSGRKEIAFYGGSFTGLDKNMQEGFLSTACGFIGDGLIDSIRISTRPDYITDEGLSLLKKYTVETVELGVQSMSDEVLRLSGRGHKAKDTTAAVMLLKKHGFKAGLQIMPGLPGDTRDTILFTAAKAVELQPDFVRIYPTLVIRDTPLEKMYLLGSYNPWSLTEMTDICKKLVSLFNDRRIPIIRLGLQPTEILEKNILAGPYHQSFRELVDKGLITSL
ncbi:MAG: radical SAM protein [Deltaproteobacteria bacterium]|nr:radical SAM protein [Deltaproteobacteria bacterium]